MRRDLASALRLLVVPTVALAIVVAFVPGRVGLIVRIYALVVCALAMGVALAALRRAYPDETPQRAGGAARPRPDGPSTLGRIEHETALGIASSFDLHYRLAPRIRSIAGGLLESRRRISLEAEPERAEAVLSEETWSLVRPDRAPPEDRLARGISPEGLTRVVDSLEQM